MTPTLSFIYVTHLCYMIPSFQVSCCFWPVAQVVNFAFLPTHLRTVYVAGCSFIWTNILSFFKAQPGIYTAYLCILLLLTLPRDVIFSAYNGKGEDLEFDLHVYSVYFQLQTFKQLILVASKLNLGLKDIMTTMIVIL